MKRNLLPIVLALFLSFTLSGKVFAYENDYVKVAIKSPLKLNYTVNLSSDGFQLGIWDNGFNSILSLDDKNLVARIDSYYGNAYGNYQKSNDIFTATHGPFHIKTNKIFFSYDEALYEVKYFRDLNIDAFIYCDQGIFEIWVGQFLNESMARQELIKYEDYFGSQTDIIGEPNSRIMLTDESNQIILMFDKSQSLYLSSINTDKSIIKVEDAGYRDYITFSRKGDELIVINNIKIQNYLYGVVPKEMSASWALEALKAQAIAAKNYTLINMNKHINEGYNLCDTTHCQVYGGYNSENIMTNRAVDETAGRVLMYNNEIVEAYYHSSSGGRTENSENVWSGVIPYLRGVEDDFSLGSPYDSWQFVISEDEIRAKFIENGLDVGNITDIQVVSTSENGRVIELMIRGTMGTQVLKKEQIRQVLGASNIKSTFFEMKINGEGGSFLSQDIYIYSTNEGRVIKQSIDNATVLSSEGLNVLDITSSSKGITLTDGLSTKEIINKIENNTINSEGKYVFMGKGWGHGVGMSQWGAKKMAELGYSYEQILEHYYTGAKVK
ncbi:SpoIID/LytB domain-containing protein [Proteiniborus sp. MB09-C3]|uniref:SpoIID/LytB domain-containing protein n=1 Tax=Proteiniborus sp. MB09-C3 TaxID=3050072 RepID=UPI0025558C80|nr:SpoIID/LytB domain-containing protein [Proteiniborus sp. MB09-C3]WIV10749.1 SpoIID/LytB domain-containing protein [Proteiniborus sp. MB09-C3]